MKESEADIPNISCIGLYSKVGKRYLGAVANQKVSSAPNCRNTGLAAIAFISIAS